MNRKETIKIGAFILTLLFQVQLVLGQDGYAMIQGSTTGGAGGETVKVSTASDLIKYATATAPYIIQIQDTIKLSGRLDVRANKTIEGVDQYATLDGNLLIGVDNVIVRNLNITNPQGTGLGDGISIWSGTHVFVNHVSFKDCVDGMCDITDGSKYVTVSYCKFWYEEQNDHRFVMILGNGPFDRYGVTIHHNWFGKRCDQRQPTGGDSDAHIYNNFFNATGNSYCTFGRGDTRWLVENNYYSSVKDPCSYSDDAAAMEISGNIYDNCTGNALTAGKGEVEVPYEYKLTETEDIPALVQLQAGNIGSQPDRLSAFSAIKADQTHYAVGVSYGNNLEVESDVRFMRNGNWLLFRNVDFGSGASRFAGRIASDRSGILELRLDSLSGIKIGEINIEGIGGWRNWRTLETTISGATGLHDLYLVSKTGEDDVWLFNLSYFYFSDKERADLPDGIYSIRTQDGHSLSAGSALGLQPASQTDDSQKWIISKMPNGFYTIQNRATSQVLSVEDYSLKGGASFEQTAFDSARANQQFGFVSASENEYTIVPVHSNMPLTEITENLIQKENTNESNQRWILEFQVPLLAKDFVTNFSVYPNPTSGRCTLDLPESSMIGQISVTDVGGKVVFQSTGTRSLDLSHLKRGVYILLAEVDDKEVKVRLIRN